MPKRTGIKRFIWGKGVISCRLSWSTPLALIIQQPGFDFPRQQCMVSAE